MFNFLKGKNKKDKKDNKEEDSNEDDKDGDKGNEDEKDDKKQEGKGDKSDKTGSTTSSGSSGADLEKLKVDVDKIKSSVEALQDVRKSFSERFNRTSEQIGELRAMISDKDKSIQEIELKATKAQDLVDSVHPEKIKTDVQKVDAKTEALKANLEGNESIMDKVMEELKDVKKKIKFFRGVDEIVKLSEEVKNELIEIKKIESNVNINTDKVNTLYSEIRKKYQDLDKYSSDVQELKANMEQNKKDINGLKDKTSELASKDDLDRLVQKIQKYIDALKDIKKKSSMTKDIEKLRAMLNDIK